MRRNEGFWLKYKRLDNLQIRKRIYLFMTPNVYHYPVEHVPRIDFPREFFSWLMKLIKYRNHLLILNYFHWIDKHSVKLFPIHYWLFSCICSTWEVPFILCYNEKIYKDMLILVCYFLTFSLDREADIRQCINGNPTLLATPIISVSTSASRLDLSNSAKNSKIWPILTIFWPMH